MEFSKIQDGIQCNCINDTFEDFENIYARRVGEAKELKLRDFRSHHERGKIPKTEECEEICGYRGVSIEIWNDKTKKELIAKYQISTGIAPKLKNQLAIFIMRDGAGKVKFTPNQPDGYNPHHFDMFKDDNFTIEKLALIELFPIAS